MPGVVLAWITGEALLFYRSIKNDHRPPMPGQVLASSGVFAVLGLLAQNREASFLAGAMAWGFDVALFMKVAPEVLAGNTSAPAPKAKASPAPKGGAKTA